MSYYLDLFALETPPPIWAWIETGLTMRLDQHSP